IRNAADQVKGCSRRDFTAALDRTGWSRTPLYRKRRHGLCLRRLRVCHRREYRIGTAYPLDRDRMSLLWRGERGGHRLSWRQELCRLAPHRPPPALEGCDWLADFGDRLLGRGGIDDDDIGRVADGDPVIPEVEEPRGTLGKHREDFPQFRRLCDLQDIGMQIGHSDQRAIA